MISGRIKTLFSVSVRTFPITFLDMVGCFSVLDPREQSVHCYRLIFLPPVSPRLSPLPPANSFLLVMEVEQAWRPAAYQIVLGSTANLKPTPGAKARERPG